MKEKTRVSVAKMPGMNRRMWNDISAKWQKRQDGFYPLRFFRRGRSALPEPVHRLMGPVRGRTLLDMQCGSGEAALSWANKGAEVTGLDISDERLGEARKKAESLGIEVKYVRGNCIRMPFRERSFDRVYTGGGVTAWIPDMVRWAREIARVLKCGGRFIYYDRHPFTLCLIHRRTRLPVLLPRKTGYFDDRPTSYNNMSRWLGGGRQTLPQIERNWTLAQTLNALADSGLRPRHVMEFPVTRRFDKRLLPKAYRRAIPGSFLMRWDKVRGG